MFANLVSDAPNGTLTFTQTVGQQNFIMDPNATYGDPAYPTLGVTPEMFYVGGLWLAPEALDHVRFQCVLYGALVYDEKYTDVEAITAGEQWASPGFKFDIPNVAPPGTYHITIQAEDASDNALWAITTSFQF